MHSEVDALLAASEFASPWELGYRRGFIEMLTCSAEGWFEHAAKLRAAHPLTRVALTTTPIRTWETDVGLVLVTVRCGRYVTGLRGADPYSAEPLVEPLARVWRGIEFEVG